MAKALILVVPGLLALSARALAALPSLSALARFAGSPRAEPRGIAAALLAALGAPDSTPVGPLALLGAGVDPEGDYVLCADLVHLVADRDTVVLAHAVTDLSANDADTLVRMLDGHFADDDLRFAAVRPDAWFARRRQPAHIVTTPPDTVRGRTLIASLPRGPEGGKWQRWQNEIEMLLHEHAVNLAREARREPAANAVWFWGGGRLADVGALPISVVTAPPSRIGDLARGIARHAQGTAAAPPVSDGVAQATARAAAFAAENRGRSVAVLAITPALTGDGSAIDTDWITPALDRLAARDVDVLHLVADGNGAAATWTAKPPGFWQRLAAHTASRRPLVVPARPDA
jgi:hypothetical protein